ncbi:hypothetical protein BBK36DRAFT_1120487 [Trichoderma citrinoviride]|uniref:Bacteriophage T5 Orf172 DNA-binding domain-containing protein n=1 Tax=Trichoderma citrinoviride TaxID=58853 RepID=A0A2T4B8R0_9HYPO|nr:hypothetical protein BBK36DRAFT_1120487 [Trichoderma citrinoviride]PTB65714.1 hypothetical protein BBK36DRAFT_1120487 [Trichoderma citrinoviride]
MVSTHITKNPVFEALAIIQAGIDKFPNPGDNLDFIQCRSLVRRGAYQCQKSGCKQNERQRLASLYSEFQNMTECLDTHSFYEDMEYFITYTHCSKHREAVYEAFKKWKDQRLAAPPSPQLACPGAYPTAYLPESPLESPVSSVDAIFSPAISQSSDEMFHTPFCDEPDAYCAPEDDDDPLMTGIVAQMGAIKIDIPTQVDSTAIKKTRKRKGEISIPGLGIGGTKRALSLTDHTLVLRAFYDPPSDTAMQEGSIYVLEHLLAPGFFKIGVTGKDVVDRVDEQACLRENAKMIYETKTKFRGARKAEKLVHRELHNYQFLVDVCEKCGGGHIELFKAPKEKIFETIEKIERVVQMPAYFRQGGNWKLTEEAKILLATIYGPLARDWREVLGEGKGAGRARDVIPETMPQQRLPPTPTEAETTQQESTSKTSTQATAKVRETEMPPTQLQAEAGVITEDDIEIELKMRIRRKSANPGEAGQTHTSITSLGPESERTAGGIWGRGFRALAGRFKRDGSVE